MKVEIGLNLEMAKPVPNSEPLSSGTTIINFDNGRKLTLDFSLTTTNTEGNTYYIGLYDMNEQWPEEHCDEEGIGAFKTADFRRVVNVEELYLCDDEDNPCIEDQVILHASAWIVNVEDGETLCELSDKEFANTDFGEFYPNEIGKALKEVA